MNIFADWLLSGFGTPINIPFSVLKGVSFGLTYLISVIFGVFVAIEAWVIEVILSKNIDVLSSPVITKGFPVVLSIANLGFVIGIIVIAIMTIIRSQSYGMKQILWKLIFMAIIVNFGLVICGAILNLSDGLTMYWLNSTNPAGSVGGATSCAGGVTNCFESFHNFATSFAGSFSPQKAFVESMDLDKANAPAQFGAAFGNATYGPIIGVLFTVFTLLSIVIVLGVFAIMLLVRYVYLVFLMVLLPLAWVSWVFPITKSNWDKWWHTFLRQAFFPPLVIFFIWLTITTSKGLRTQVAGNGGYLSDSNPLLKNIANIVGNAFASVVGNFLDAFVLCALSLGGIYAANSMGIKFAGAGVKAMESASKGLGSYVGRRAGGAFARRATAEKPAPAAGLRRLGQLINPMTGIRAAAQSEFAEKRGYTETLKQYGKKTDFGESKRLWRQVKERQVDMEQGKEAIKYAARSRDAALFDADGRKKQAEVLRNQAKTASVNQKLALETQAKTFDAEAQNLSNDARKFDESINELTKGVEKTEKESNALKEKTWETFSSNRGVVGSTLFGALKGAGIYKGKSKLKLSKEQIDELAKASGVDLGGGTPAPATSTP